ncbi:MAG: PIN domain-containing protein [Candidatus Aenigmatarchaeota archaeon]
MEKNQEKIKCVIINSNIFFSSIIREDSYTRAVLLFLRDSGGIKFIVPKACLEEFKAHIGEISRKSGLTFSDVLFQLQKLVEDVETEDELKLKDEIKIALEYVSDEKGAPFVAVALKHKPSYILTYNKKDYKKIKLKELGISVITPKEAIDLIQTKFCFKTREKRKKNLIYYLTKFKIWKKSNNK